jgi:hypothetical protein
MDGWILPLDNGKFAPGLEGEGVIPNRDPIAPDVTIFRICPIIEVHWL